MDKLSKIILVEDDDALRTALGESLNIAGYCYIACRNVKQAMEAVSQSLVGLVLTDINLPEINGIQFLEWMNGNYPQIPVIIMTAYGNIKSAVEIMQKGALDYLEKPFSHQALIKKIEQYGINYHFDTSNSQPVVADQNSIKLLMIAQKVAQTDSSVLILGESGTGKEVLARYIHHQSSRKAQPFIAINCAAIPDSLLESILFGHEKGAFSGAHQSHAGKFEQANEGTLLLDEISEMPLLLQAKLLRVLQEKEVERIGGKKVIPLNIRILATTNKKLDEEVKKGNFREDLYYRLNVFPLEWLPLRERKSDILPLVDWFLKKKATGQITYHLDDEAKEKLLNYYWPGNIRELDNVIQRAVILAQTAWIKAEHLILSSTGLSITHTEKKSIIGLENMTYGDKVLDENIQLHEFQIILDALKKNQGSRQITAKRLGISPRTLRYKMAKMKAQGIDPNQSLQV